MLLDEMMTMLLEDSGWIKEELDSAENSSGQVNSPVPSSHAARNAKTSAREILRLHFVALRMTLSFMFLPQIISLKYNQNALAHCKKCDVNKLFRLILGA